MNLDFLQILNCLGGAVAAVEDGTVRWSTDDAQRLGLIAGTQLASLLPPDVTPETLPQLQQLSMPTLGAGMYAQIYPTERGCVLILHTGSPELSYASLAQTSRMLREPLDDILFTARSLFERLEELEDARIQAQTSRLNRGFYRLLRTASALSELQQSASSGAFSPERADLKKWLRDLSEHACSLVAATGKTLEIRLPAHHLYAEIDAPMLEQALWCLLSNAIRYSPEGATITLSLQERNGQCLFSMHNPISQPISLNDLSGGFTRPLSPESEQHGLGLGLVRAQQIVRLHSGVLLLECTPTGIFAATIRIPGHPDKDELRLLPVKIENSGGFSQILVELSDVLPDEVFDTRSL